MKVGFRREIFGVRFYRYPAFLSRLYAVIYRRWFPLDEIANPVVYFRARRSGSRTLRALVPSSVGRLGNGLIQLGSALTLARIRGAGDGVVIINSEFPLIANGFHKVDGIKVLVGDICAPLPRVKVAELLGGPILQGDWFYSSLSVNKGDISPGLDSASKLLKREYVIANSSREGLVIHYRVGDIFGGKVHPGYGPPPHSFFELVVRSLKPKSVRIVAEEFSDDLVQSLAQRLSQHSKVIWEPNILRDDVRQLLSASHLALSVGTFGLTISGLSRQLQALYQFEDMTPLTVGAAKRIIVRDSLGEYVKKIRRQNWLNSPIQRRLVVNYPIDNLRLEGPTTT